MGTAQKFLKYNRNRIHAGLYDSISFMFYWVELPGCRTSLLNVFNELDALVEADDSESIQQMLNLCHAVDTDDVNDVAVLFQQHIHYVLRYFELDHGEAFNTFCEFLPTPESEESALERFGEWMNTQYGNECRDIKFDTFVTNMRSTELTGIGATSGARQRFYMQCSQTGLFQITDDHTWLPNRIQQDFHNASCQAVFGDQFDMNWITNALNGVRNSLGSYDLQVTNAIYTNGELDAWSNNGIWFTRDAGSIALNIARKCRRWGSIVERV